MHCADHRGKVCASLAACSTLQRSRRTASVQCVAAPEKGRLMWGGDAGERRVLPPPLPLPAAAAAACRRCCLRPVHRLPFISPSRTDCPAVTTQVQRNKNMGKLQAGYLFPEVRRPRELARRAGLAAGVLGSWRGW